ncbi:MAG: hypothetical protein AAGF29_07790 [Pseudomonadota bacterium]
MGVLLALLLGGAVEVAQITDIEPLDPITTGGTITEQAQRDWEERREAYKLCKECIAEQAFPEGELPED